MSFARRAPHRGLGRTAPRTPFASPDMAWRALVAQVRACAGGEVMGLGKWEELSQRRSACIGAAFPVISEPAKAASGALLEIARTWRRCSAEEMGWHSASAMALADQCEALLDQQRNAVARRISGERD